MVMKISVQSDIDAAMKKLASITERQQFNFAAARALTQTAAQVQAEVRRNMPGRFMLRRQWVVQGIRIEPATKANLVASVYSRDKFMGLQETGGTKSPLRNYLAIPTSMVRRTKSEIIRKSDRPTALGDKAEIIDLNGHKWLALKKPRKGAGGQKLKLLYLLIPRAQLRKRLGLEEDGVRVTRARFMENLERCLAEAVARAR